MFFMFFGKKKPKVIPPGMPEPKKLEISIGRKQIFLNNFFVFFVMLYFDRS